MPAIVPPRDLLADLARRGFTVRAVAGSLSVVPGSRLTPTDREALRQRRGELLSILSPAEPWNTATALGLMDEADRLVERLGEDGTHPEVTTAAEAVVQAHAIRDLETLRFAVAEFAVIVRRLAGEHVSTPKLG